MQFKTAFCSKRMKSIQIIETNVKDVIPLNNADSFFYSRSSSFGIIKRITCFSRFELCFGT